MGVLTKYMSKLGKEHQTIVKRVFRILCGTTYYAIYYQGSPKADKVVYVQGFVDAYQDGDLDRKRPKKGYMFNLFGGEISWMSRRWAIVALSTINVEDKPMQVRKKCGNRYCVQVSILFKRQ